ncbi:MAG: thioredoxin domain-containing protein [Rhodospirillales bacterium]|nr:thioredoxin domain-containing protein [Rhodospirillales bacterium]MCW8951319.1 thioredoxin domain-containing protein [Rhodospirillales bacterium]
MSRNRLNEETSPYLLQHKDNPVHWRAWGDEALEEARQSGRPILLSVGYAACHWCHVMAHESFEDEATAALMNDLYINIKVDREERPDLDAIYQSALAMMGEQGGWPLTMFLTPDGEPFWGGTYFPPERRYGRPGFPEVLSGIAESYRSKPKQVLENAATLRAGLVKLGAPPKGMDGQGAMSLDRLTLVAERSVGIIDFENGGTMGAPKFPQPALFEFLWRAWRRTGQRKFKDAVLSTLRGLSMGGIYDHLGGGFARYSTDDRWLVPHFEKMLYDNGLLLGLFSLVWRDTRDPLLAARVRETVDWAVREMWVTDPECGADGAFAAALDADSEGVEGQFYVWSEQNIDRVLGADAALFKTIYDVSEGGNWEGTNVLNLLRVQPSSFNPDDHVLSEARKRLLEDRAGRIRPGCDDKVLADWNGLMIEGLAKAAMTFERKDWLDKAESAFRFIVANLTVDGRLRHSWREGRARHPAVLDDYANMAAAALSLHAATQKKDYLKKAEEWVAELGAFHGDPEGDGYFLAASDVPHLIARTKPLTDNAVPSGNATAVSVLARLYHLTGKDEYRAMAGGIVSHLDNTEPGRLLNMAGMLAAFETLADPVHVAIIGDAKDPKTTAMIRAAHLHPSPGVVLVHIASGESLPDHHPAYGKTMVDGKPTAYVCRGTRCGLPVMAPEDLTAAIDA